MILCAYIYFNSNCRGESTDNKTPFRKWYGRVIELRSLLHEACLLVLTATASPTLRKQICIKLGLTTACLKEIIESPNHKNIKLSIMQFSASTKVNEILECVIDMITSQQNNCKRTVYFVDLFQTVD